MSENNTNPNYHEEIKQLMEKNLKVSEEILKITKSLKSHMILERVFGILKILIILVPIILGIMYLPPLIEDMMTQYKELLSAGQAVGDAKEAVDEIDFNLLPESLRGLIK